MYFIRNRIQEFLDYNHINQVKKLNDIFSELRDILHPKTEKEKTPLNWGMLDSDIQIENIADRLEKLRTRAGKKVKTKLSPYLMKAWKILVNRLDKYKGKLDPVIEFKDEKFILPRTNNLCETGFRDCKRQARRTTGMRHLSNHMDNLPPQYFYTFNLNDQEYVKAVYGDGEICDSFHEIDKNDVKKDVEKMKTQRQSPKVIDHKLIGKDDYLEQITKYFTDTNKSGSSLGLKKSA